MGDKVWSGLTTGQNAIQRPIRDEKNLNGASNESGHVEQKKTYFHHAGVLWG